MKLRYLYCIGILLLIFCSCAQPECTEIKESLVSIGFVTTNEESEIDLDIALANIKVYGVGMENDSVLYNTGELEISTISIPLSPASDTCKYIFDNNGTIDTLTFYYERQAQLISVKCGFHYEFMLKDVIGTEHSYDSLKIINDKISSANERNIKMFFNQ